MVCKLEADLECFFATTCFFCDHFEELQTVLIKVKLMINNAPLTYVYPNVYSILSKHI